MTSKTTDKHTEESPDARQLLTIDKKLALVSCPFTWGMEMATDPVESVTSLGRREELFTIVLDRQDYFPELVLMFHLLIALTYASRDDLPKAMESISKAEGSLADIKQKATELQNVESVLDHIFIGSKCHVLKLQGRLMEVDELLGGIHAVCDMNKLELGMLSGCKCLTWTLYNTIDGVGIRYAKKAIEFDPSNGKWYFLLGQIHREARKALHSIAELPSTEETSAFEKAYVLSQKDFFGVSLAQLYRESRDFDMANKIYKEVHALQPTCCTIRLQLALGFIRAHECELAKECLDYVAEKKFITTRYNHYMGIYEEKCNRNFEAALPYYQSTTEQLNWVAECQYLNCRRKVERDWDPLPHMVGWLKKYEGYPYFIIQEINIHIGSYYLFELHDIPAACKYLLDAITLEPNTKRLKKHWVQSLKVVVNLYQVLANEVQMVLRNDVAKHDNETIALLKDTQRLCSVNCKYVPPHRTFSLSGPPSSQSPRSYQNYGRGSLSHPGIGGRAEQSSSSTSRWRNDFPRSHENHSSNAFRDNRRLTSPGTGRYVPPPTSWRSRDKNDGNVEDAACELVKTVKDLKF